MFVISSDRDGAQYDVVSLDMGVCVYTPRVGWLVNLTCTLLENKSDECGNVHHLD